MLEGVERVGQTLVFPARNAWVRRTLSVPPGCYALTLDGAPPVALWIEVLVSGKGWQALPLFAAGGSSALRFACARPIEGLRWRPVEHGQIAPLSVDLSPAPPWRSLLPDIAAGSLRFARRDSVRAGGDGPRTCALAPWGDALMVRACDGVTICDQRFTVEEAGGALLLALPTPLAGPYAVVDALVEPVGAAPLKPRIYAARSDGADAPGARLFPMRDGRMTAVLPLRHATDRLIFQPRHYAGEVVIKQLTVRSASRIAALGTALAVRRSDRALRKRHGTIPAAVRPISGPAEKPPLSAAVVMATRNAPGYLKRAITTAAETHAAHRLVVVDNGSDDPRVETILRDARGNGTTVLTDDRAFNFAAMNNYAARACDEDVLVFANDDLSFTDPNWLGAMLAPLADDRVGIVGAVLTYPGGHIQHAGKAFLGEIGVRHVHRYARPRVLPAHGWVRAPAVTAALMAVRRSLFETLGGFDAGAFPILYNDTDLCLRAQEEGAGVALSLSARAVHHESASLKRSPAASPRERRPYAMLEAARFHARWGHRLALPPPAWGEDNHAARAARADPPLARIPWSA